MPVSEAQFDPLALASELGTALREAGPIALRTFRADVKSWTKNGNSPVSEADIAVDNFLRKRLRRDGFGWLSEESQDDRERLNAARLFIVDPIDGTRSYLAGLADWSIVAAVVERGRPVAAAVYVPVDDALYLAAAGSGATRNGETILASEGKSLAQARVAGPKKFLDRLSAIDPATIHEPKIHSLALRMTRVAEGRMDAAFASIHAYDWDLAAADLLVHEAGGLMTALDGRPLLYNRPESKHDVLVAAGRERHAALIDLMQAQANEPA